MSGYIEKDLDQEYFCTTSGTIPVNPDERVTAILQEQEENLERWKWLIEGWSSMSFKEKMAIFMPYLHYVNPRNNFKTEFDEVFGKEIVEYGYKLCRNFDYFHFDPDGQGIPNIVMVFKPINPNCIPDATVKASVIDWGVKYGFLPSRPGCCK